MVTLLSFFSCSGNSVQLLDPLLCLQIVRDARGEPGVQYPFGTGNSTIVDESSLVSFLSHVYIVTFFKILIY